MASPTVRSVTEGHWMSTAALWSEWIHVGRAVAVTECKVLVLSSRGIFQSMTRSSRVTLSLGWRARRSYFVLVLQTFESRYASLYPLHFSNPPCNETTRHDWPAAGVL